MDTFHKTTEHLQVYRMWSMSCEPDYIYVSKSEYHILAGGVDWPNIYNKYVLYIYTYTCDLA